MVALWFGVTTHRLRIKREDALWVIVNFYRNQLSIFLKFSVEIPLKPTPGKGLPEMSPLSLISQTRKTEKVEFSILPIFLLDKENGL